MVGCLVVPLAVWVGVVPAAAAPDATNDHRADATLVPSFPYVDEVSTDNATTEEGEWLSACSPMGATVWYEIAGTGAPLRISTAGSDFDTVLAVYSATSGGLEACNDDSGGARTSLVQVETTGDLYVQVGGWLGDTGTLRMAVDAGTGSISGRVLDTHGAPIRAICIEGSGSGHAYAITRSDGRYTLSRLLPGSYVIHAYDCSVGEYDGRYYPDATDAAGASPIVVSTGAAVSGIDLTLPASATPPGPGTLAGTVTDLDSNPLSHLCVSLFRDGWSVDHRVTGTDGTYIFDNLPSGNYLVRVDEGCIHGSTSEADSAVDSPTFSATWFPSAASSVDATPVAIAAASTTVADLAMARLPLDDIEVVAVGLRAPRGEVAGEREVLVTIRNIGAAPSRFAYVSVSITPHTAGAWDYTWAPLDPLAPGAERVVVLDWDARLTAGKIRVDAWVESEFDADPENNHGSAEAWVRADLPVGVSAPRCNWWPVSVCI